MALWPCFFSHPVVTGRVVGGNIMQLVVSVCPFPLWLLNICVCVGDGRSSPGFETQRPGLNVTATVRVSKIEQSCPWVHFVWPDPTRLISWLTQPNPTQPMGQANPWTTLKSSRRYSVQLGLYVWHRGAGSFSTWVKWRHRVYGHDAIAILWV